jgi:hypothetical protein
LPSINIRLQLMVPTFHQNCIWELFPKSSLPVSHRPSFLVRSHWARWSRYLCLGRAHLNHQNILHMGPQSTSMLCNVSVIATARRRSMFLLSSSVFLLRVLSLCSWLAGAITNFSKLKTHQFLSSIHLLFKVLSVVESTVFYLILDLLSADCFLNDQLWQFPTNATTLSPYSLKQVSSVFGKFS